MNIIPYEPPMRQAALDLALRAWEPVFPQLKAAVPGFVYGAFYPEEWQKRQLSDLGQILDNEPHTVDVAMLQGQNGSETPQLAGWVCTRIHPEDSMGEVYILAVDPQFQRRGIGHALMDHSHDRDDHDDGRNRRRTHPPDTPTKRQAISGGQSPAISKTCNSHARYRPYEALLFGSSGLYAHSETVVSVSMVSTDSNRYEREYFLSIRAKITSLPLYRGSLI